MSPRPSSGLIRIIRHRPGGEGRVHARSRLRRFAHLSYEWRGIGAGHSPASEPPPAGIHASDSSMTSPEPREPLTQQPEAWYRHALQRHQEGRVHEAAVVYRRLLALAPSIADLLHLLGLARYQAGDAGAASV